MKILKGNYGECRICDNMDTEAGLPSLKEKSWDLCLTDIPYDVKGGGLSHSFKHKRKIIDYESKNDYWIEMPFWWDIQKTKCDYAIFSCGYDSLGHWCELDKFSYIFWLNRAKNGGSKTAYHNILEPFLIWNIEHLPQNQRFNETCIEYYYGLKQYDMNLVHPCPRASYINRLICEQTKPKSVIDPFFGSGSTGQVCEELGIPWLGYEIMGEYIPDIEKRIALGIAKHKTLKVQTQLFKSGGR